VVFRMHTPIRIHRLIQQEIFGEGQAVAYRN
jgi:hypothetical protein